MPMICRLAGIYISCMYFLNPSSISCLYIYHSCSSQILLICLLTELVWQILIACLVGPVGCLCMLQFMLASFVGLTIFHLYMIVQVSSEIRISMQNLCLTPPSRCRFHINMMPFVMESILSYWTPFRYHLINLNVIIWLSVCKPDCVIRQQPFVNLDVGWEQINTWFCSESMHMSLSIDMNYSSIFGWYAYIFLWICDLGCQ
jgi:hypothetical protein